jgi:hypothetical protein
VLLTLSLTCLSGCGALDGMRNAAASSDGTTAPAEAAPVASGKSSGPIALTEGIAPAPIKAEKVPPPAPPPANASPPARPAARPVAAAVSEIPATAPSGATPPTNCPAGTIGMWSQPDIAGSEVYICRQLHPPRPVRPR